MSKPHCAGPMARSSLPGPSPGEAVVPVELLFQQHKERMEIWELQFPIATALILGKCCSAQLEH